MKSTFNYFLIAIAVLFLFIGCQSQQVVEESSPVKSDCLICDKGISGETVWCASCDTGYVKGDKVKCHNCFQGMTAKKDVWCESCNTGYLKGDKVDCKKCCATGEICEMCKN